MDITRRSVGMLVMLTFLAFALCPAHAKEAVSKPRKEKAKDTSLPGNYIFRLRVDGFNRYYTVHVPPGYDGKSLVPAVVMFHAGGSNSRAVQLETGWNAKADQETFLAVYPDALPPDASRPGNSRYNPQLWNDGSGRFHQCRVNVDDVGFTRAMLEDLGKRYKVNKRRIYATGLSNGAAMVFRAGAEISGRFAAIAPVGGSCWLDKVQLKRMVPLCYITGSADSLNKIEGGMAGVVEGKGEGADKKAGSPVRDSIRLWGSALGCPARPQPAKKEKGVRTEIYAPCRDGAEMVYVAVDGMGNSWPAGKPPSGSKKGTSAVQFKANDLIWDFFQRHEIPAIPVKKPPAPSRGQTEPKNKK